MKRSTLILALVSALVALGAAPGAAFAKTTCVSYGGAGYNPGRACATSDTPGKITACDTRSDRRRVRANYYLTAERDAYYTTAWAPQGGCITERKWSSIYSFRVCVEGVGCSAWKRNRF